MTSEPITFLWAELEAFRGFRDERRIDLDASSVIVTGPNGTGKTSFFDGLQWLLLGSLERLEPWRTRRNTEHIVNAFRPDDPAVVSAGLRFGNQLVEIRRQGRHDSGVLEWRDDSGVIRGDDAERRLAEALSPRNTDRIAVRRLLMTSALLQQDVIRNVLEDKAADRYQHLTSLLGLEEVGGFEVAARRRSDRLADGGKTARAELGAFTAQQRDARERLEVLRRQQAAAPDSHLIRAQLKARLTDETDVIALDADLPASSTEAALLQSAVSDVGDRFSQISRRLTELSALAGGQGEVSDDAIAAAERTVEDSAKKLAAAQSEMAKADADLGDVRKRSEALAALAHAALPLLTDHCPVCQQQIDEGHVQRHLEQLRAKGGADLPAAQRRREEAAIALQQAQVGAGEATEGRDALLRRREAAKRVNEERVSLVSFVGETIGRGQATGITFRHPNVLEALDLDAIAATTEGIRVLWRILGDLTAAMRSLPNSDQIAQAERDLQRLDGLVAAARERTTAASAREEEAKTLQRAATRAAAAVTEARFRILAPLVGDIFSRLDPHPIFKDMDFALGVYRERGEATPIVRDAESGIEADPLLVFSSSQANVAALSYFLALGWAAGKDAMPFVLLDDPLQSLDDINSLGFADLCRHIRRQRQLIVSTHDPRLAALLERKLAPRLAGERTRVVEFHAWSRGGPDVDERLVPDQLVEGERRAVVTAQAA